MDQTKPQLYTAAQIASALGKLPRSVRRSLAGCPADSTIVVFGQSAKVWSLASLPLVIQNELERAARRDGFRNVESLLLSADQSAAQVCSDSEAETECLITRETDFQLLRDVIAGFKNPAEPSLDEKSYLWLRTFEAYEEKISEGRAPKKVKRSLFRFLAHHAVFLVLDKTTSPVNAIRVNFQRKYGRWIETERNAKTLADRRAEKSGRWRGPELSEDDLNKLIGHAAVNCGGRVAQAWRELVEGCELSEAVMSYYLSNPASKSYVPQRILKAAKYEVRMLEDIHHGPRQHALNGAYLGRDWSGVHSMDWLQSDDVTEPVYFRAVDNSGSPVLMRGQVLPMIDLRSTRILGFVLLSSRNYNANAIRSLITRVCDEYSLPRKGFYFENGSWRAKIIKGDVTAGSMSWAETELGLREYGLRFVHARMPRAKPVERVIGAMQNLMEGMPGYIGRNEQIEKFERVQRLKLEAERGNASALSSFLDEDQWADALEEICARYNAARQDGKMTGALSPDEAFECFADKSSPPIKFSPECRYLLAHHRRPSRVGRNGITLRFGREVFNYRNENTGRLRGQTVLTWFDPENPEILTVTDGQRKNAFCVARSQDVPAMEAPIEILAQELARIEEHQAYAKARYRILKPKHAMSVRRMVADRQTIELGEQIGKQREAIEYTHREEGSRTRKVHRLARELGLPADISSGGREAEEGLEMMRAAQRAHDKQETEGQI